MTRDTGNEGDQDFLSFELCLPDQYIAGISKTKSRPVVTVDNWVWFQDMNDELIKIQAEGTQLSRPGNKTTSSPPTVVGDWVYFRGTDNKLWMMSTAGNTQYQIGDNRTNSTPFVTADG